VRLLCWNVAGRVRRLPEQAERIASVCPDLVCLQEVTPRTGGMWFEALAEAGWPEVAMAGGDVGDRPERGRPLYALTAARAKLEVLQIPGLPWPERAVATVVGGIEVINVHSPISPKPGLAKVRTHEAIHAYVRSRPGPLVLCGDLNTPRKEHADGRVWTFARTQHGKLRPDRGERWDQAELALIKGLEDHGFRDAFRERHGLEVREVSWEWRRWGGGYRLDHLIVSAEVEVPEISYLHPWRKEGLSDHSPLLAEVRVGP